MALLEMKGIVKTFGRVCADDHVNLTIEEGEIHALLGENGAGKTTLMNILYGLYKPDEGEILWRGRPLRIQSPSEAIAQGIGMVHQHFMLVQKMSVLQNIILGLKPPGYPFINISEITQKIKQLSEKYGLSVDIKATIQDLSVGAQQRVEILKALYRNAKLLILDEPTSVLTPQETTKFFEILRLLKQEGHSIILIAHNLDEILDVSDRVTVLRDGKNVCTIITKETNASELSRYMIGRELCATGCQRCTTKSGAIRLNVQSLSLNGAYGKPLLDNISLYVREGEVLGIAGVDGNGQKELAEVLTAIRKQSQGSIYFEGQPIDKQSIRKRFESGITCIPSDRHRDGLILDAEVIQNLFLRSYYHAPFAKHGISDFKAMDLVAAKKVESYNIKTPDTKMQARYLSGGNQQKIIVAREVGDAAKLILACQPTRGLDIGATEYVREQLIKCRNSGGSVLLISTDLCEILAMSDRIAVLYDGRIMGTVDNTPDLDINLIGLLMGGQQLKEGITA